MHNFLLLLLLLPSPLPMLRLIPFGVTTRKEPLLCPTSQAFTLKFLFSLHLPHSKFFTLCSLYLRLTRHLIARLPLFRFAHCWQQNLLSKIKTSTIVITPLYQLLFFFLFVRVFQMFFSSANIRFVQENFPSNILFALKFLPQERKMETKMKCHLF